VKFELRMIRRVPLDGRHTAMSEGASPSKSVGRIVPAPATSVVIVAVVEIAAPKVSCQRNGVRVRDWNRPDAGNSFTIVRVNGCAICVLLDAM